MGSLLLTATNMVRYSLVLMVLLSVLVRETLQSAIPLKDLVKRDADPDAYRSHHHSSYSYSRPSYSYSRPSYSSYNSYNSYNSRPNRPLRGLIKYKAGKVVGLGAGLALGAALGG